MNDEIVEVWAVDTGAYEDNHITWLFHDQQEAKFYAEAKNAAEEAKGGYRSMGSYYDVSSYKIANTALIALADDAK